MTTGEKATVLVVDDDRDVADTYRRYLEEAYATRVAHDGRSALEELDDDVDAVLLDRRMPGLGGDAVLDRIRERGLGVPVAMVTAVDADVDVVGMGFDAYVTKPTTPVALRQTVADLLALSRHAAAVREYHALLATFAALLEGETPAERDRLRVGGASTPVQSRLAELEARLESHADLLTDDARFVATLRALDEPMEGRADG
jgi:DNA-binding response OmpR family regulator